MQLYQQQGIRWWKVALELLSSRRVRQFRSSAVRRLSSNCQTGSNHATRSHQ